MSDEERKIVPAGEFIVGTLVVAGIVKPEDAQRAREIVEEEVTVWLAIRDYKPDFKTPQKH
jgi:hypothetical protein